MSIFSTVPAPNPKSNKFNLSHERKMSFSMGDLVPCLVKEVLPGDVWRVSSEMMARFAPMLAPIMHRVDVRIEYFFVPNRLVWNQWENFITGGKNGTSEPVPPYLLLDNGTKTYGAVGTLWDYMGLPIVDGHVTWNNNATRINLMAFRAYQLIYNEYYRDQNLSQNLFEGVITLDGGIVSGTDERNNTMQLRKRAWEKDYFTSALPYAQRGAPVELPIDVAIDWGYKTISDILTSAGTPALSEQLLGTRTGVTTDGELVVNKQSPTVGNDRGRIENIEQIEADATSLTINDLRVSIALQQFLEANARGGSRYIEQIMSHFGVRSSDGRLQRPEFLGGGKSPVVVSEVLQTVGDETDPLATMGGHGISVGHQNRFQRRFEEHGHVIGIVSILPRTAYQDGIPSMWTRFSKLEYPFPLLANLGEQAIKNQELYFNPVQTQAVSVAPFGYTPRYADWKYCPSSVHGNFRGNLDFWHMGRKLTSAPALNESFVMSNPTTRIFAVEEADEYIYSQMHNRCDVLRKLPYFGVPGLSKI